MGPVIFFISTFFLLYALLCVYVGLRGYEYLGLLFPGLDRRIYWAVFTLVNWSYFLGMALKGRLPASLEIFFSWLGSYWLATLVYLVLLFAVTEVIRIWFPAARPVIAVGVVVITLGLLAYGTWNAQNPRVVNYTVKILKAAGLQNNLRVVMVSDIHLGSIVGIGRLNRMVDTINLLEPDLVLMAGDITDRDFNVLPRSQIIESLQRLRPRSGKYAVLGNHDYYSGMVEELIDDLKKGGVRVLRDETELAAGLCLVGRDERQNGHGFDSRRRELSELMQGADCRYPVVLLDHQPSDLEEAERLGVDLMLAGHTHRGQLFPFNLITQWLFEVDWGYLIKGNLQVIVSCGYGTWGPPIRLGNTPEVVCIDLQIEG